MYEFLVFLSAIELCKDEVIVIPLLCVDAH